MGRDCKNGGMGFKGTTFAGCDIVGDDNRRDSPDFQPAGVTMKLAPVFITSGAATTAPDQIGVRSGSQPQPVGSVPLFSDMDAAKNGADDLIVTSPFGYNLVDVFILDQPATTKKGAVGEVPANTGSNQVSHNPSPNYLYAAASRTPRFNKAGGLGVVYQGTGTANVSRVFNLGNLYYVPPGGTAPINLPVYNFYAVANGSLTVTSQFLIDSSGQPTVTSIADNIVQMRAVYGLDDGVSDGVTVTYNVGAPKAGDGIVARYVGPATFNPPAPLPWP